MEESNIHESEAGTGNEERVAAAEAAATEAIRRYRELVASGPDIVGGLVRGETVAEIDASAEEARRAYGEISRRVAQGYEGRVPPGNVPRSTGGAILEHLKPEAKIALGLRKAER